MDRLQYERQHNSKIEDNKILHEFYLNSRISINELSKKFGVSHHTMSKRVMILEKKYQLHYTLDLDLALLGFSESRLITVKFEKMPDLGLLKKVLGKDPFVQNAYLASGNFDLIIHGIASTPAEYGYWEFKFRIGFSKYKPKTKTSTLNHIVEGFMPIKPGIISKSIQINEIEKKILTLLIKNSRIRIKEIAKLVKLSQMRVINILYKLQERGIIKRFTTSIQSPDKRIFLLYCLNLMISGEHHPNLLLKFLNIIIGDEEKNQATTDYSVVCSTTGIFDSIYICNFKNGMVMDTRGPNLLRRSWESEHPIIEDGILTEVLIGEWPFNTNNYTKWKLEREIEQLKPIKFKVY